MTVLMTTHRTDEADTYCDRVALMHRILAAFGIVVLGSAFFSCLSMTIAGIALKRDRLTGVGQAKTCRCSSAPARSTR